MIYCPVAHIKVVMYCYLACSKCLSSDLVSFYPVISGTVSFSSSDLWYCEFLFK